MTLPRHIDSLIARVLAESGVSSYTQLHGISDLAARLSRLVALTPQDEFARQLIRSAAIEHLKAAKLVGPARLVDAAYSYRTERAQASSATSVDPEPWQDPVELQRLLSELVGTLSRFVVLKAPQLVAIALWILHTHCLDAAAFSPRLAIISPTKRCGKTTLLKVLQNLVQRPRSAANISSAALFRIVEQEHPTLLIDEADTFLEGKEELRGILNTGHDREGGKIIRCKSAEHDHEVTSFDAWGAVAIALIGRLPSTLADRAITIELKRMSVVEKVDRFRRPEARQLVDVRRRCVRWARDNVSELREVTSIDVTALDARAADNWEPLLAIAHMAGAEWTQRTANAAERLSAQARAIERENDYGERLLNDIRALCLDGCVPERVALRELARMLAKIEDAPWARIDGGRPLDSALLAKRLRAFDIVPKTLRLGRRPRRCATLCSWNAAVPVLARRSGSGARSTCTALATTARSRANAIRGRA